MTYLQVVDGEIFERIQEYFAIYGNTAQEISCYENRAYNRIVEQTAMVSTCTEVNSYIQCGTEHWYLVKSHEMLPWAKHICA